ncbi:MAG: aldo/keto reductase [Calditrichaeota bacterium]|nr:aldo/keto reductase [Calditrichota bacterium]
MKKITRRSFIKNSIKGTATMTAGLSIYGVQETLAAKTKIDQVVLGKSGIKLSRLAMGTGTHGWKHVSDQTKLGVKGFVDLAQHAFDSGITFFDVADIYGSHTFLREALKYIPREKVVILTKIWTAPNNWIKVQSAPKALDRFRKEIGTDYLDIVLIHSQTSPNWPEEQKRMRDDLSEAKEKGIIRTMGASCHSLGALKAAAGSDWLEVLLTRINPVGVRMDDTPEKVMPVIKKAYDSGKGVIGMKIFGCGKLVKEQEREASLNFVLKSGNVDAMTIGFENRMQMDDTIRRINRIVKA